MRTALRTWAHSLFSEVATKTNDAAGDGTTTATLLAQAFIHEGMKNVTAGANPMVIRKGIQKAVDTAVASLKAALQTGQAARQTSHESAQSPQATKSSVHLIADAMEKVTADGVITSRGVQVRRDLLRGC